MKILSFGKKLPWWVGFKAMCPSCKTIVKLEAGDDVLQIASDAESIDGATALCPMADCKSAIRIKPGKSLP